MQTFRRWVGVLLVVLITTGLIGCDLTSIVGVGESPIQVVQSSRPRDTSPDVPSEDLDTLVAGNTDFSLALYRALTGEAENLFYSPLSMSLALAMTYGGARGETATAMAEAMRFTLPSERLHPAFNALDLSLGNRGGDPEEFELHIANATWGQQNYEFLESYLELLAVNYGAAMRLLDFVSAPDESRQLINRWVEDQTNDRIQDLLPPMSITPMTVLVLTNAIYFNAEWRTQFPPENTSDGPFTRLDGTAVDVPMMRETMTVPYASGDGYQAIELPYLMDDFSMLILLPDAGRYEAFEDDLTTEQLSGIIDGLSSEQMALTMPKFSFTSEFSLNDALTALGMGIAFTGDADLSGMDGTRNLFISSVVHKAFVAVDEEGTEAAAATGVVVGRTSMPTLEIRVDRPFIFAIRDRVTGSLLFMGRVLDPSA